MITAQAIGRLGNYFNQELFGSPTTLPWALEVYVRTPGGVPGANIYGVNDCEFPTDYIKATPEVLCGAGYYHPTFLYELVWNLLIAAVLVWADRRFRLGGGRVFALYVAGYTLGRGWIETLRIDPARTHLFGLRINVVTSMVLFVLAIAYLIWKRNVGREDPALLQGLPSGAARKAALAAEAAAATRSGTLAQDPDGTEPDEADLDGTDPDADGSTRRVRRRQGGRRSGRDRPARGPRRRGRGRSRSSHDAGRAVRKRATAPVRSRVNRGSHCPVQFGHQATVVLMPRPGEDDGPR